MAALNVVRFRTRPGREQDFIAAHQRASAEGWAGFRGATLIRTGEHSFCFVGQWDSMEALATARPQMIAVLDSFRDTLEELGQGLGVTDPVSGPVVVEISAAG